MSEEANTNPISSAMNIPDIPNDAPGRAVAMLMDTVTNDSATEDFSKARNTLVSLIETGMTTLDDLIVIAKQSQSPRAYEVVSELISQLAQTSSRLLDHQERIRRIHLADSRIAKANEPPPLTDESKQEKPQVVNQNLFVGSTEELQRFLKNMNNGNNG